MGLFSSDKKQEVLKMNYKALYMRYMQENDIKFTELNEDVVRVSYIGDNFSSIVIYVIFQGEDTDVQFRCEDIAKVNPNKVNEAIVACNKLNAEYRWVKFYVREDGELRAEMDAVIDAQTVGEECSIGVQRMVRIVDEAYPKIMGALWG